MNDIQEQTHELLNNILMGKYPRHHEVKDLLRRFVEEHKRIIDGATNDKNGYLSMGQEDCLRIDIDKHFAWLLEGE